MTTVPTPAPFRIGQSLSRAPMGPLLVYCPTASSMNKRGILEQTRHTITAILSIDCHSPAEEEHDEVGDQEGPAAGLVGVVGKPPDVSQSNSVADTGKEEGDSGAPGLPLFLNSHPDNVQFMYSFRQWFVCSIVV